MLTEGLRRAAAALRRGMRVGGFRSGFFAGLIALYAGVVGAAAGGVLTGFSRPPDQGHALAVAAVAVPERPRDVPGPVVVCDYWCPDWDGRDNVVAYDGPPDRTDFVRIVYNPPVERVSTMVEQARERLAAAGWRVEAQRTDESGMPAVEASKGATRVSLWTDLSSTTPAPAVHLLVTKNYYAPVIAGIGACALAGMLAGWLGAAWVVRRSRRQRRAVRVLIRLAAVPLLMVAVLMVGESCLFTWLSFTDMGRSPKDLLVPLFLVTVFPPLTLAGVASAAATAGLAALRGRATARPSPPPAPPDEPGVPVVTAA